MIRGTCNDLFASLEAHLITKCSRSAIVIDQCPSSVVRRQQFALKAYSNYTHGQIDSKRGKKLRGDL